MPKRHRGPCEMPVAQAVELELRALSNRRPDRIHPARRQVRLLLAAALA